MIPTSPATTISNSNSYGLREKTQKMHELNQLRTPVKLTSRKALDPQETASRVRDEEHDCDILETDHTVNKVAARLFGSLFRFCLTHSFNCTTWRGRTYLNGAHSTCGGCEAAHAALSPTLYDDILPMISNRLSDKPFGQLEQADQQYLITRFKLIETDIKALCSNDKSERVQVLSKIVSRLSRHERKGTFIGTSTERVRNATYDNPRDSNRFDSHLERHLRLTEDTLANECSIDNLVPTQALLLLQKHYRSLVERAIPNLQKQLIVLKHLKDAADELFDCQSTLETLKPDTDEFDEEFKLYVELAGIYLRACDYFFTKDSGTPRFKSFQKYLTDALSPYTLKMILRDQDSASLASYRNFIEQPEDWEDQFHKAKRSIERRLLEAENQHRVLHQDQNQIKGMVKHLFGEVNSSGVLITPTKDDIRARVISLVQPVPPPCTDLEK